MKRVEYMVAQLVREDGEWRLFAEWSFETLKDALLCVTSSKDLYRDDMFTLTKRVTEEETLLVIER